MAFDYDRRAGSRPEAILKQMRSGALWQTRDKRAPYVYITDLHLVQHPVTEKTTVSVNFSDEFGSKTNRYTYLPLGVFEKEVEPRVVKPGEVVVSKVYSEVVDEWVSLNVELRGKWDPPGNDAERRSLFDRVMPAAWPAIAAAVKEYANKKRRAEPDGGGGWGPDDHVEKYVPIPRSPRDFETVDFERDRAFLSLSTR